MLSVRRLLFIVSIPTLAFAWVVLQYLQLDGERTVTWQAGERSPFINAPLPADRVEIAEGDVRLAGDPIYFHVTPPPGRWQSVTVQAEISPGQQSVIELGTVVDARTNALDMRPAYSAILEAVNSAADWQREERGDVITYTRTNSVPTRQTTRIFRAPNPEYPAYHWSTVPDRELPIALQGGHEWLVYAQNGEDLQWTASLTDQNLVPGPDESALIVIDPLGNEIARASLADSETSEPRPLAVRVRAAFSGAYRIVLSSTSDITWSNLRTNGARPVVKNHIRFAAGSSASVWTTAAVVGLEEPVGKRAVGLGEGKHRLPDVDPGTAIVGDGWFAVTEEDLWSPTLTPLTTSTNLAAVNQIIAAQPSFTQTFDFSRIQREPNGSFRLILSLPGVSTLPAEQQPVLHELKITYKK